MIVLQVFILINVQFSEINEKVYVTKWKNVLECREHFKYTTFFIHLKG